MAKESEVRFSYATLASPLRPDIAFFWKNNRFIEWGDKSGYSGAEFLPLRGAARDVIKNSNVVASLKEIKTGHVALNPYATFWSILARKPDPLRSGKKLQFYNLGFAEPKTSIKALHKLEEVFDDLPVVTYPSEVGGKNPYGEYKNPWIQTHPAVFDDESTADDLITKVKKGKYSGVVWDTYHALEASNSGKRPFIDWPRALGKLLEAGVLREIHVQAGRIKESDPSINDLEWLRGMVGDPNYNSELGHMIRFIKSFDQNLPFVIEVHPYSLYQAGLIAKSSLLRTTGDLQKVHQELIEFVKSA